MEFDYVKLKQIKPALSGYIRESQVLLKKSAIPDEKTIHDIRVLMKKSRAVLKLIAPQSDSEYQDRNISELREVGRIMRTWRESTVLRKNVKQLKKEFPEIFSHISENSNLNSILQKPEQDIPPTDEIKASLEQIGQLLNKTGYRIRFQSLAMLDPQLMIKELELLYARVSNIYLMCRNNPQTTNLHKFRKKAKDFLYQLYFFRPLNPSVVKALEKELDYITLNLGKYNDLAQIIKALGYDFKAAANTPAMDELIIKIREKQDKHLSRVWPSAYNIFCPGQKLVNVLGFKLLVI